MTDDERNDRLYENFMGYTVDEMIDAARDIYELNYAWGRIWCFDEMPFERRIELLAAYTTKRASLENGRG